MTATASITPSALAGQTVGELLDRYPFISTFFADEDTEGLLDEVRITAEDIRRDGFGERAYFECLLAEIDGEAVGIALFFHN